MRGLAACGTDVLILDGGTGRELKRLGAPFRQPEWSALALIEPAGHAFVSAVHAAFLAAGATVITTNSYALCPFHIGAARFAAEGAALASLAGRLARGAVDAAGAGAGADAGAAAAAARVAGSLPPTCGSYRADLFDAATGEAVLRVLVPALAPSVDLWLAETLSAVAEAELAARAVARDGGGKPLWLSFTLDDCARAPPRLRGGEPVAAAAAAAARLGAEALLFNCSQPEVMGPAIAAARAALDACGGGGGGGGGGGALRLGAYANAFEPQPADAAANEGYSTLREELTPAAYRAAAQLWCDAGATIVGGCCGITPAHIAALARAPSATAAAAATAAATWDARYAGESFMYGEAPNDWLRELEPSLPRSGAVLCLAEGEGRNAVFLAQRGHRVTAVDLSPVGVAKTLALAARRGVAVDARVGDLAELRVQPGAWDAIISIWAHVPRPLRAALLAAAVAGLRPAGALVFEAYHPRQLQLVRQGTAKGGPPTADLLAEAADVAAELAGLRIVAAVERERLVSEGTGHAGVSAVTQVFAVKEAT